MYSLYIICLGEFLIFELFLCHIQIIVAILFKFQVTQILDSNETSVPSVPSKPINTGVGTTKYLLFAGLFVGSILVSFV